MGRELSGLAKTFVENLKHYRNRAGLSQADVAEKLELATTTLSGWEGGKWPTFGQIDRLAELYGINSADFFISREAQKEICIENDLDFVECIWALVRSRYVAGIKAANVQSYSVERDPAPKLELELVPECLFDDEPTNWTASYIKRSELNRALDLTVQMYGSYKAGNLTAELFEMVVNRTIKDLRKEE